MSSIIQVAAAWFIATVLFAALIIYISKHPQKRTMPLKIIFALMFLGGMALYCTCHYLELQQAATSQGLPSNKYLHWVKSENASLFYVPYVIMRSVVDVGTMFYGRFNSDVFFNLGISREPLAVMLFWLIHLIAFYTAASALLIRFGNDLLRWIRIITSKISDADLIFGINSDSLSLAPQGHSRF